MIAYIAFGSNLGDREKNINEAQRLLDNSAGVSVEKIAEIIETPAVGGPKQPDYFNSIGEVETSLELAELLNVCQSIEKSLGRDRAHEVRWGPRTIDLDIVLAGDLITETQDLTIPHPRMHEREFVLLPLSQIAPDAVHPVLKMTVSELLKNLERKK